MPLVFLAPLLIAGDAPKSDGKADLNALAAKLATQSARIQEGERVQIQGDPKDAELLEDLAVQVRKQGAFPLVTLTSDRLSRRLYDDVSAKYDSQPPEWDLKLAGWIDAEFIVESADEAALAGVPAERIAAREKLNQPVFAAIRKRNVRLITLGNGLYPTASRAKQFGLSEAELSKLFWDGVNVDYTQLQAAGEKVKKELAQGKEIRLTNPNGTDLKASIEKRPVMVSDGVISDEKRKEGGAACWTYLPAGEVYVSTAAGTAEGRVVVDRLFYKGKEIDDLVLDVSDVSNPRHDELDEEVDKILRELGVEGRPRLRVLNKMDRLAPEERNAIASGSGRSSGARGSPVLVSALTGEGIEELLRRMDAEMPTDPVVSLSIRLPLAEGRTLAMIHALGRVLHSETDDSHMRLDAEVPASIAKRLRLNEYAVEETFPRVVS
jgi:leucyl aminopeptidase (aminopeptidase T)